MAAMRAYAGDGAIGFTSFEAGTNDRTRTFAFCIFGNFSSCQF
jgi:hypothetical protein